MRKNPRHDCDRLYDIIDPYISARYALGHGWTEIPVKFDYMRVFKTGTGDSFHQVTVPLEKDLRNYIHGIRECIETFSITEDCTVEQVFRDMGLPAHNGNEAS